MTREDFDFLIACKKPLEFTFRGIVYNLTYGKDEKGDYIAFGRLYEQQNFYSYGDLLNQARVENHFFREMIEEL